MHSLLTATTGFSATGLFHIYSTGMTEKFNHGDCGPAKLTATANALLFYGDQLGEARYTLYQRDRLDVADPLSMLWYNPHTRGTWFHSLPLDRDFPDPAGSWVSMRSSWTDPAGLFVAAKAGRMTGHASRMSFTPSYYSWAPSSIRRLIYSIDGNLDAGTFVLDALGERWAGELCQDDYLAPGYFSNEDQESPRWEYYRCGTAGQNTLLLAGRNQVADAEPRTRYQSTRQHERAPSREDSSFWIANLTMAYNGTRVSRGIRLLDGRRRVLVQDEIESQEWAQWRMHTSATITYDDEQRMSCRFLSRYRLT